MLLSPIVCGCLAIDSSLILSLMKLANQCRVFYTICMAGKSQVVFPRTILLQFKFELSLTEKNACIQ
jgi:hypothetical protein